VADLALALRTPVLHYLAMPNAASTKIVVADLGALTLDLLALRERIDALRIFHF
jgi:hypothetical protein